MDTHAALTLSALHSIFSVFLLSLIGPALTTLAIVVFMGPWNSFFFLNEQGKPTPGLWALQCCGTRTAKAA